MSVKIDGKEYATIPEMSAAVAEFIRVRTFNLQQEDHCQNECPHYKHLEEDGVESQLMECRAPDGNACPAAQKTIAGMINDHLDPKSAERKARKLYKEIPTSTLQEIHEVAEDIRTKTFARYSWNCRGCEFLSEEDKGVECVAPAPTWCPKAESLLNDLIRRARGVYQGMEGTEPR